MDELTDLTQCPVCFEEYQLDGYQAPRILPCSHTLCEKCLETLIGNNKVDCPECRIKHQATAGKRSFPQNKYIIAHIKTLSKEGTEFPKKTHTLETPEAPESSTNSSDQILLSSSSSAQVFAGNLQWRVQDFPDRERPLLNLGKTNYLTKFCQKLHENKNAFQ